MYRDRQDGSCVPTLALAPVVARRPWTGEVGGRGAFAAAVLLTFVVAAAGCGDRRDPSPQPGGGSNTIRGGERLVWDQSAVSAEALQAYRFSFYVDGQLAVLSDVRCGTTRGPAGFECSGRLPAMTPGPHVLQLSAVGRGPAGPMSAPFAVVVTGASVTLSAGGAEPLAPKESLSRVCAASGEVCFEAELVGALPGELTSPVATPEGRLLVVRDRRAVHVVDDADPGARPALESADEIESLAIGADFAKTHVVYLATVDASVPDGSLVVTRYREVRNVLGEPAVIAPGLPLAVARLAVDGKGRIYVAGSAAAEGAVTEGVVLRITADGGVPWDAGQTSIALAEGVLAPRALVYDDRDGALRLVGESSSRAPLVRRFQVRQEAPAGMLDVRATGDESLDVEGLALVTHRTHKGALLIDRERRLAHAGIDAAGALAGASLLEFPPGAITGVAAAPGFDPYVLVRDAAAGDTKIFRLRFR
jgi:hypothetical protein